jgi:hypothetical protein
MAWSASKIFVAAIKDALDNTTAIDLGSDIPKVALYNNSITPSQTVTSANSAFDVDQWDNANELSNGGWSAGGLVLATPTWTASSNVITYDAADTANVTDATISGAFGCLVYDDTLAAVVVDQGLSYHYFGGTQSVTAGVFTIVWNASGIFALTL